MLSYLDVLKNDAPVGKRVALIGAGGIGFDVAEFLTHQATDADAIDEYLAEWGVDRAMETAGGLKPAAEPELAREVTLVSGRRASSAQAWARPPAGFIGVH